MSDPAPTPVTTPDESKAPIQKLLIGLMGRKGSGKDAVHKATYRCYDRVAFAAPLKYAAGWLFDFSGDQLEDPVLKETVDPRWGFTPRRALQVLGTEVCRGHLASELGLRESIFVTLARRDVQRLKPHEFSPGTMVTDVRFEDEAKMVLDEGGFLVLVTRPSLPSIPAGEHVSETLEMEPHLEIINDGTLEQLKLAVAEMERILKAHQPGEARPLHAPIRASLLVAPQ